MEVDESILPQETVMQIGDKELQEADLRHRLMFTEETVRKYVIDPPENKDTPIFYDRKLYQYAKAKFDLIQSLKADLKPLLAKQHQVEHLKKFITICESIQNFDLKKEIDLAKRK